MSDQRDGDFAPGCVRCRALPDHPCRRPMDQACPRTSPRLTIPDDLVPTPPQYEQHFSAGEVQALDYIVKTLLRGGTPTMVTRHKEFASLCRKVIALKAAAE